MTVIRPNSVSGINSITAQADEIKVFKSDGTQGGLIIGGANLNATSGISTILALNVTGNVSIAGTLTYQDVTNVDSVGIITARSTIDAQGDVSIVDKIIHTGDTNTAIRFPAADTVTIETGGSERLRIDSNGKITHTNFNGQGLHMSGSGDPTIRIQDTDGTNQYGDFAHNAGDTYILTRNNTAHGEFVLYSNNGSATSVRLKIDYNGKILTYTTGIESSQFLTTNSGGAYQQYDLGASGAQLGYIGAGSLLVSGSGVNDFGFRSQANMVFSTGGAVERLRITSGGQIRLPVNGQQMAFGASQQFKMYWENSEDRMYLQGDGAYGMAFRINGGNRLEINKTTGDITMQGASGRNFNWDNSEASLYLTDNGSGASARLKIGTGADFQLYHDVGGANHIVCANNQELKLSANLFSFYDYTGVTQRLRIGSSGEVSLRRGGISATPSLEIYGSGNHSDSEADNLRVHNWGNSDGDYWQIGVNSTLDGNGNNAKPSTSTKGAAIRLNAKNGKVTLITSPSSTSTQYEGLSQNENGIVTIPHQPAFRSYTTSDNNSNGVVSGIWKTGADDKRKFDNNDDFNESNGRFTAPVDGVYQISVAWDELHSSATIIDVQINGGGGALDLYSTEQRSAGSGWNSWFTSSIAKLASGDYVTINLRNTSGTYPFHQNNGRWGHYSIYLIG